LEQKAADPNNKILILCNPHNPVGRVWTAAELTRVAEICARHEVFVISDEIHGDFTFLPHCYTPFLKLSQSTKVKAVTCLSPAKTFNISGLVDAFAIIPHQQDRETFHDFSHRFQTNKVNVLSSLAMEIAYREGAVWLDALLEYLRENVRLIRDYLKANVPKVSLIEPEGTFLVWLDFRGLGLEVKTLEKFLAQEAQLALSPGYWFGREGAGFARMTIGCPRATVEKALDNLAKAAAAFDNWI
jgi:cystathionine beta-lyase